MGVSAHVAFRWTCGHHLYGGWLPDHRAQAGRSIVGYKKVEIIGEEYGLYNDQTLDIEEATMEDDSFAGRILLE